MIRWITDSLGTAPWDGMHEKGVFVVDVRDLVDKEGNTPDLIQEKIRMGYDAINCGRKVVVCCDYGVSRSNAIAAGILSVLTQEPYYKSLLYLSEKIGETEMQLEVIHSVSDVVFKMLNVSVWSRAVSGPQVLFTDGESCIGARAVSGLARSFSVVAPAMQYLDLEKGSLKLEILVQEHRPTHLVHIDVQKNGGKNSAIGIAVCKMKNVIDVCAVNDIKLVYVSSSDVFSGYCKGIMHCEESLPPLPRYGNGVAKALSESMIIQTGEVRGLRWVILRAATIYGCNDGLPKYLHAFISKAMSGEDIVVHKYRGAASVVDLLHVEDLCSSLVELIKRDVTGILHVGSGIAISTRELAEIVRELIGSPSRISEREIDSPLSGIVLNGKLTSDRLGRRPAISLQEGVQEIVKRMINSKDANNER